MLLPRGWASRAFGVRKAVGQIKRFRCPIAGCQRANWLDFSRVMLGHPETLWATQIALIAKLLLEQVQYVIMTLREDGSQ